jgi:LPXTG-motif cell wall-anchored protein
VRVEIVIALLCCAVTLLGVVYLGAEFFDSSPPPSQPQAKGIVWGGRTFVDLAEFSRWLRSRGVAYEVWAVRHPTRAGLTPLRPATVPQAERAEANGAGHRSTWTTVAGVAVALAALALLLGIRRRRWLPRIRGELTSERLGVAAQRVAAGARLFLRVVLTSARALSSWAGSLTHAVWRRRGALAWYVAGMLFAAMSALALTAWA